VKDGAKLGRWLFVQRQAKKRGSLDPKQITRLNELGIVWDLLVDIWDRSYQFLCNFYGREGHYKVIVSHVEDGTKLGVWLNEQKRSKKKGSLDTERITRLEKLGIV